MSSGMIAARPILSRNHAEARRRALNLYRAWYRQLPYIVKEYKQSPCNVTVEALHAKLKQEFYKNKNVSDLRIIDLLIHRGKNELIEISSLWKSDTHLMDFFRELDKKPVLFLEKFLTGHSYN